MLNICHIDEDCEQGIQAARSYHREWNDDKKRFDDRPMHDWASDGADALRYLSIAWSRDKLPQDKQAARYPQDRNFNELVEANKRKRMSEYQ